MIVLVPDPVLRGHVKALLELDGYAVTEALNAVHLREVARASRAQAVLVHSQGKGIQVERVEASLLGQPTLDVLAPRGFGHALVDGAADRRRLSLLALDALGLFAETLERTAGAPPSATRAARWADLTARRLGLSRLNTETTAAVALLAGIGAVLVKFRFGDEAKNLGGGGLPPDLRAALSAAATLRSPFELVEGIHALDERWDGRGRPDGLAGPAIPIAARVVAVVREHARTIAQGEDEAVALERLRARAGSDHDPAAVDAFLRVLRDEQYLSRVERPRRGATIAVIDGDPGSLAVAEIRLGSAGFSVRTFQDGRDAFDALTECPTDLIVADLAAPGLDGLSLFLKLRRDGKGEAPVFFTTAAADPMATTRALKLGAADVVAKPVSFDVLIPKLREAVAGRSQSYGDAEPRTTGDLGEMGFVDLLQVLALGRRTATVHVESPRGTGWIALDGGEPVAAATGRGNGVDAFCELASWQRGRFWLDAGQVPGERNLTGSLEGLLLEALRRVDERGKEPAAVAKRARVEEQPRG